MLHLTNYRVCSRFVAYMSLGPMRHHSLPEYPGRLAHAGHVSGHSRGRRAPALPLPGQQTLARPL